MINENLWNIGKEIQSMSKEEFSSKLSETQTIRNDCLGLGIPFPIESELELLYLETGKRVMEIIDG